MATSVEGVVYQANFKTRNGTLLNVYATNGGEFGELLDAFEAHISKIASIESLLGAASTVAATVPVAPPSQQPAAPAPSAPPAPGGEQLCNCGQPAKLIPAGVAKSTGKPYRAFYACAQPRGSQCDFRLTA
jgi:hypothetical protein